VGRSCQEKYQEKGEKVVEILLRSGKNKGAGLPRPFSKKMLQ
jgi:hypothetical protein